MLKALLIILMILLYGFDIFSLIKQKARLYLGYAIVFCVAGAFSIASDYQDYFGYAALVISFFYLMKYIKHVA